MAIELSLCVCVWNTSHLLKRSVQTYLKQDIDPSRWELIVIDDNSQDDVEDAIAPLKGKINLRYERLDHSYGMRGCTVAFNTAFKMARGSILAETTAESMLPKDAIRQLLTPHLSNPKCFVALKTYNLTREQQKMIDMADWQSDIMNISKLPGWDSKWCQNNVATTHFGTHMICSIRKEVFFGITKGRGFPLFGGYGCLSGETRVLTADLKWVRNDSLKVGDMLVGVTEHQTRLAKRKLELSRVNSIQDVHRNSFRVVTEDGRDIIASEEHLWLMADISVDGKRKQSYWKRTDELVVGDEIRKLLNVGEERDSFESGWMAGFLDGEGSTESGSGLRIRASQNPGSVLDYAMSLLEKWKIDFHARQKYDTKASGWSKRKGHCWDLKTRNTAAALELLISAPARRFQQRWVGIGLPTKHGCVSSRVVRIEPVGMKTLIGMKTSTKTFIAEGLVSHNCEDPWYAGTRQQNGVQDITLPNTCMGIHQWHAPFQYWMAKGRGPMMNKHAHTMSNYMGDTSGYVPAGGTCMIWDGGSHEQLSDADKAQWATLDADVLATGVPAFIVR